MAAPTARKLHYVIWTVGCQMNKADSERIENFLDRQGYVPTAEVQQADLVILNTCAVRRSAEEHTEGQLGQLAGLKKRQPNLAVAMTGCMVVSDVQVMQRRYPMVDLFFSSLTPESLQPLVERPPDEPVAAVFDPTPIEVGPETASSLLQAQRAQEVMRYIPIIYGCDEHCTYCIVPARRGREQSRPVDEIVTHVEEVVSEGAREVTLLGQIVDRYGHDLPEKPDLALLLERLNGVRGLERIRFLTSHPRYIDERLIEAMRDLPKVCEYMHLPVQHGDDAMLRRMGRPYRITDYERLVERIRTKLPDCSVSTDVIVGFCGETEEQFNALLRFLERIRFDVVHVAAYSPRPGTASERHWADDVAGQIKKERLWAVEALQEQIAREINTALIGTSQEVLVEGQERDSGSRWKGRTRTNKITFFSVQEESPQAGAGLNFTGRLLRVQIVHASARALQGRAVLCSLPEA
ncbi:MAG: tRNA (N6-isopentenyl adenosine(37)-C2)-methylthiotransferase MiaB [Chloroflexi bacterium]|nr:tRNA (N6-isopentenyl adenosine(37)-C2)-methylthiotransferase MiaB [Chloroflexota bacterium]